MKSNRKIRVAAVGLGWVGLNRHIKIIRRQPAFELIGVIDRRFERAERIARKLGLKSHAQAQSLKDIPWLCDVDAVTISVPPQAHFALVKEALAAGKHVLTEKPFVMSVPEGEELVEFARRQNRTLAIVHNFQFAKSFLALQKDIERGGLGHIRSVSAVQYSNPNRRLPEWYDQLPLGLFYDESPHLLYLLRKIAGRDLRVGGASVYQQSSDRKTPATLVAQMVTSGTSGNIPVTLTIDFTAAISEWYLIVHTERAVGIVDLFRDIYLRLPNDGRHTAGTVLRTSLLASWQHWIQHLSRGLEHVSGTLMYGNETVFSRFAQAIGSGVDAQDIGPDDALAVTRLQHEIISSAVIIK